MKSDTCLTRDHNTYNVFRPPHRWWLEGIVGNILQSNFLNKNELRESNGINRIMNNPFQMAVVPVVALVQSFMTIDEGSWI